MPELPDITIYLDALRLRVVNRPVTRARVLNPFVMRSVEPPIEEVEGKVVRALRRLGKRIVLELDEDLLVVIHLMIAGRFRWLKPDAKPPGRISLAVLEFAEGTLVLTEAGTKRRASIHLVRGEDALAVHDPGGIEVLGADDVAFRDAIRRENHTLKRTLTDPCLIAGIGNAYSDEILHAARLSPLALTSRLTNAEIDRLYKAARETLQHWIETLRRQFGDRFPGPGDITAFRPDFAAHGKYGQPCPVCSTAIQRIRYAENETNYCPGCQTGGRVLADRSLSRLLKDDWPRSVDNI